MADSYSGRRQRIGLVLGAGGATGAAFHAGTLLALQQDVGWDPHSADLVVGSSAGSIIGALLRSGLTTDDLCAWGASVAALPAGRASRALLDDIQASRHRLRPSVPHWHVPSPRLLGSLRRSSGPGWHTALLSLVPHGWIDAGANIERVGRLLGEWPERPLWVTAVRTSDARRVVFGRDDLRATPGQAVAASCAIPGVFRPVTIAGRRYIDGGAHSPTNADLLLDADVDAALVLSPMSASIDSVGRRPDQVLRGMWRRRLRAECDSLTRAGIEVHVIEPDVPTLDAMGVNALDDSRTSRVVSAAFLSAGAQLAERPGLRTLLDQRAVAVSGARAGSPGPRRPPP